MDVRTVLFVASIFFLVAGLLHHVMVRRSVTHTPYRAKRLAVCIAGQVRENWQAAALSIYEHICLPHGADVYMCVDEQASAKAIAAYRPVHVKRFSTHKCRKLGEMTLGHSSYFQKMCACIQAVPDEYECVLHCRPDLIFLGRFHTHDVKENTLYSPHSLNPEAWTISWPSHNNHGAPTDQCFYGDNKTMKAISQLYAQPHKHFIRQPERLIKNFIEEKRIGLVFVPMHVKLISPPNILMKANGITVDALVHGEVPFVVATESDDSPGIWVLPTAPDSDGDEGVWMR